MFLKQNGWSASNKVFVVVCRLSHGRQFFFLETKVKSVSVGESWKSFTTNTRVQTNFLESSRGFFFFLL